MEFSERQLKMIHSLVTEKLTLAYALSESSSEYNDLQIKYQIFPNFEGDEDNLTKIKQNIEKELNHII